MPRKSKPECDRGFFQDFVNHWLQSRMLSEDHG